MRRALDAGTVLLAPNLESPLLNCNIPYNPSCLFKGIGSRRYPSHRWKVPGTTKVDNLPLAAFTPELLEEALAALDPQEDTWQLSLGSKRPPLAKAVRPPKKP